jgi:hypothetical protein
MGRIIVPGQPRQKDFFLNGKSGYDAVPLSSQLHRRVK